MNICFDMDGTICDLYGYSNWLEHIYKESAEPYLNCRPLVNLSYLARLLNQLKRSGNRLYIISWTSKNCSKEYKKEIIAAKGKWLQEHLKSVEFDNIYICDYGLNKSNFVSGNSILFDDSKDVRNMWSCGKAYTEKEIFSVLKNF